MGGDGDQSLASRGAIGGASDEAGADLRASIAAWAVAYGLGSRPLPVAETPADDRSIPVAVALESDAPVDDVVVHLRGGTRVFIQSKLTASLSKRDKALTSASHNSSELCARRHWTDRVIGWYSRSPVHRSRFKRSFQHFGVRRIHWAAQ